MNIKSKSALVILFAFVIGLIAGALLTQTYFEYRIKKILAMRTPEGFVNHFEKIIEPTPQQKEMVLKILNKYGKRFAEIGERFRKEFFPVPPEMRRELDQVLTPEQRKRVEEYFHKYAPPGFRPPFGDPHRPPHGMPPPPHDGKSAPPVGPV